MIYTQKQNFTLNQIHCFHWNTTAVPELSLGGRKRSGRRCGCAQEGLGCICSTHKPMGSKSGGLKTTWVTLKSFYFLIFKTNATLGQRCFPSCCVCCLHGFPWLTTESFTTVLPPLPPPQCSYLALVELLSTLWTAWTMASRSMPKSRSSSWGLPLRGTWETARRCTVKPVSFTTAEHTASPRPPEGEKEDFFCVCCFFFCLSSISLSHFEPLEHEKLRM